ncbi:hypothetical protein SO802_022056 [Lithocarpus litseifolius]|uniref:Reverse transcriptase zinc-binding domain-containing protein n=1 Tax=Lithocarpus litseifolius TaxID=425828 RepID=A0AAW2CGQ3_9ROSI
MVARKIRRMKAFRDALDECGLKDLGYTGDKFTWKGKRQGGMVFERLNKAVANNQWSSLNPGTSIFHLQTHSSDHKPIVINPEGITPKPNRPFKFEKMWLSDGGCSQTVKDTWGISSPEASMAVVAGKLKHCRDKLLSCSRQSFGSIKRAIDLKSKRLNKAEVEAAKGNGDATLIWSLRSKLNDLLDKENQMWHQRSRALFLKDGDRNTSYFRSKASHRFQRNRILGLRNESNVWCLGDSQVKEIATQYFQTLCSTSHPSEFDDVLKTVQPTVTQDMNEQLLRPFSRVEVETAINQMEPIMAPGPDSIPSLFYQSFWSLVGNEEKVSSLIDCERHCWNQEVIDTNFLPHEAAIIKAIPLSYSDYADVLFWPLNNDGAYSVKSGYHLSLDLELNEQPKASDLSNVKRLWKGIWSLKVPNRVKTLIWQAGSNSLPLKSNLRKRKIPINDKCSNCGLESETSLYAIWSCPSLIQIWNVHFGWLLSEVGKASNFLDVLQLCLDRSNQVELLAMTVSQIWTRRNKLRVDEAAAPLSMINQLASASLKEFQQSSLSPPKAPSHPSDTKCFGLIIKDIKVLSSSFGKVLFSHTRR